MTDQRFQAIPIFRIFDEEKARDFYLGFLGMTVDFEHRFEENTPIYMQSLLGPSNCIYPSITAIAVRGRRCMCRQMAWRTITARSPLRAIALIGPASRKRRGARKSWKSSTRSAIAFGSVNDDRRHRIGLTRRARLSKSSAGYGPQPLAGESRGEAPSHDPIRQIQ